MAAAGAGHDGRVHEPPAQHDVLRALLRDCGAGERRRAARPEAAHPRGAGGGGRYGALRAVVLRADDAVYGGRDQHECRAQFVGIRASAGQLPRRLCGRREGGRAGGFRLYHRRGAGAGAAHRLRAAAGAARQPDPRRAGVFPARAAVPVAGRYQNAARAAVLPALHPDSRRVLRAERLLLRRWPPRSARPRRAA